ncbi:MAG TPA: hypothetical protein VEU33_25950, partial [Archangium sp.]|nr:hypothetical protein [Archangium sp.]
TLCSAFFVSLVLTLPLQSELAFTLKDHLGRHPSTPPSAVGFSDKLLAACHDRAGAQGPKHEPASRTPRAVLPEGISPAGIGGIHLGAPLGAGQLGTEQQARARYALRFYADAQPLEGFWLGTPPVFAALETGPFRAWVEAGNELELPSPSRFSAAAVAQALQGTPVVMLYVETPGYHTPEGAEVGMSHNELMQLYADLQVRAFPPLFEEPTCIGTTAALPRVRFFFNPCEQRQAPGSVNRIAVW